MREWLTAREIAAESLPDMPSTERGVRDLADRESWHLDEFRSRRRPGKTGGGGLEYHIGLLSSVAQVAYRAKYIRIGQPAMPPAANDEASPAHSGLSGRAALERDARLAVLKAFEAFAAGQRLNHSACEYLFIMKWEAGSLQIDDWVRQCVKTVSKTSLARWRRAAEADRDRLAVDRSASRKGKGVLETANDGALRIHMLALLADNQHLSAHHIRQLCRQAFGDKISVQQKGKLVDVEMPPVRTFQHVLKTLRSTEKVVLTKIQNPDLFRSTMAPSGRGTYRYEEPNSLWMIDASPVDALCTDGRHSIYVCIDIATRRVVLFVSRTPRASAVALLIRKGILTWGVPAKIKTDNGSDFVARDTQRLFAHLDIEPERSNAYSPQEKGHVERVIGTFQRDCVTTLPGFIGHSVEDRKAIESRKSFAARLGESDENAFGVELTGADLQDAVDRWATMIYHQRPHEGLGRKTPSLVAAQSTTKIKTVDERALDVLLMPVAGNGSRRTTKFGIRVEGRHYMTPSILPGTEVLVRMDTSDLGLVYAFAADGGSFLGVGICPELSGIHPETAVAAMKKAQREIVERGTADIKAELRRLKSGPSYFERIIQVAAAEASNVVSLPRREESHSTPQIAAAIDASEASRGSHRNTRPVDPKTAAEQLRIIAEMDAEDSAASRIEAREVEVQAARTAHLPETVAALPESPKARYRRFELIDRAIANGEHVNAADAVLLGRYQGTAEFKGQRALHEDYGDEYLAL